MGLVKPEDLSFHIRASVERGHAERIGHGVDVMHEKDPIGLLKEMAARNVLVEINLTSNDQILGVSGDDHPLPMYMKYGVPVAISTDDEGVARSDMTHEYLRAVQGYRLPYTELKRMTRQSIEHSFLPGKVCGPKPRDRSARLRAVRATYIGAEKPIRRMREVSGRERARQRTMEAGSRFANSKRSFERSFLRPAHPCRANEPSSRHRSRGRHKLARRASAAAGFGRAWRHATPHAPARCHRRHARAKSAFVSPLQRMVQPN